MKKIFIGIDFSKEKFDVTAINPTDGTSCYGQFPNKHAGGRDMIRMIKKFAKGIPEDQWLFCGEDTGHYSFTISEYLYRKGLFMWLQSAYSIKMSEGKIRRGKSDKADSLAIAEYARRFEDRAVRFVIPPEEIEELRMLIAQRDQLVECRVKLQNTVSEIPTKRKQGKALSQIKLSNRRVIKALDNEIKALEQMIDKIMEENENLKMNYEILVSFPGIARINATAMIIYTNNFLKFDLNARKIATYWGVAPFSRQSGTSVDKGTHVSGFCNHKLKTLISNAATVAIIHNPVIKQYYDRLISKGKSPNIAKNNAKNKIIHILTAMIRTKQKFCQENYFTFNENVKNVNLLAS